MRAFASFLGIVVLAGLIAAALAYPAFELTSTFAGWAFHRVASRIAMLLLIAGLIWLCRRLGLTRKADLGFGVPWRRYVGTALAWSAIGIASAAAGAVFLLGMDLRVADPAFAASAPAWAHIVLVSLASGLAVALLEETLVRGVMHTAIERESGAWMAVLLTTLAYAVLHFFGRVHIPADQVTWSSGFHLLGHSFAPLADPAALDAFLSWVIVGAILGMTRVLTGNTAVAVGLHGGWVVVLRMLQQCTVAGPDAAQSIWVSRIDGLLGWWVAPWGAAIAAVLWLGRARWVPRARP